MKINKIVLENIKSFYNKTEVVFHDDFTVIIGPNSGGKSNLLELIQGIFNDLIMQDAVIKDNTNKETKNTIPYELELQRANQKHVEDNILDKHTVHTDKPQFLELHLLIEEQDLLNIKNLTENREALLDKARSLFNSNELENILKKIEYPKEIETIIGEILVIKIHNKEIKTPFLLSEKHQDLAIIFFELLKNSRILSTFINFYNIFPGSTTINFYPYFYYVSPNRQNINLSHGNQLISLGDTIQLSANQGKQRNLTQDSQFSHWNVLIRILIENKALERSSVNNVFQDLLKNYLKVGYKITNHSYVFNDKYEIEFFRLGKNSSIKLSSGEKEFLNLISAVLGNQISNGIILIDEPELHLHPKWQKKFLNLIKDLSNTRGIQFILVTHSGHFLLPDNIKKTIRVQKNKNSYSEVFWPDEARLEDISLNEVVQVINATNNSKVFFADKLILVEGIVDRIFFETVVDIYQQELGNEQVVEVVEVHGKTNFDKFNKLLNLWQIKTFVVADLDYLSEIGTADVKQLFKYSERRLHKSIKSKNSKDGESLLGAIEKVLVDSESERNIEELANLRTYLCNRHLSLKEKISDDERALLDRNIQSLSSKNIYILPKGRLEDYFEVSKLTIKKILKIVRDLKAQKDKVPEDIKNIICSIIGRP